MTIPKNKRRILELKNNKYEWCVINGVITIGVYIRNLNTDRETKFYFSTEKSEIKPSDVVEIIKHMEL